MKRILITGSNSYIGTSFEKYMLQWPEDYRVDTLDMTVDIWRERSFNGYDTIYHVAGIAHSDNSKISEKQKALYYKVNTELTLETARKAKSDGVRQFIYMSSIIIYGDSAPIGEQKIINESTIPKPTNHYGDSKLQAENGILPLQDRCFNVVVLRSPMIYGKGSKGNYPTLAMISQKMPLFPLVKNMRSMLYIENLCEFVHLMVENNEQGIFWPQNAEYGNTSRMVKMIADVHGKKLHLLKGFGWILKLLSYYTAIVNKAFGNLTYDQSISEYKVAYQKYDIRESIMRTES